MNSDSYNKIANLEVSHITDISDIIREFNDVVSYIESVKQNKRHNKRKKALNQVFINTGSYLEEFDQEHFDFYLSKITELSQDLGSKNALDDLYKYLFQSLDVLKKIKKAISGHFKLTILLVKRLFKVTNYFYSVYHRDLSLIMRHKEEGK